MKKSDFKRGKKIVKVLIGGGFETASIVKNEHVDDSYVYLQGCDGDYNKESVHAYRISDGRSATNYTPGFSSRLILLEQ